MDETINLDLTAQAGLPYTAAAASVLKAGCNSFRSSDDWTPSHRGLNWVRLYVDDNDAEEPTVTGARFYPGTAMKPHPRPDEVPDGGFLVQIAPGSNPDALGRVQFTLYWRKGYMCPSGVRGQAFFANPDERTSEWDAAGRPWATWAGAQ